MQILRAANYKVMPWKNGLGSTTEIAISPAVDRTFDFDWRVSMAQVTSDGPFSVFPDIDRTLLVLQGNGIVLSVSGHGPIALDRQSIHAFPGDQPTSATLIDGPIVDLNVMSRRGRVSHSVRRISVTAAEAFAPSSHTLLFVERGSLTVRSTRTVDSLFANDAMLIEQQNLPIAIESPDSADLIVIDFR